MSKNKKILLVILGYILITLLMTYPLIFHISDYIAGQWDGWFYVWDLWWWKYSLLTLNSSPYFTDYIFYPIGTGFAYAGGGVTNEVIGIILQFFFNIIETYNIIILFSYVASAFAMYLLVEYLTGNDKAAFISGLIFSFSQYRLRMTEFGELTLLSTQWMVFYILFLIKIFRHKKNSDAILAGLFFSLNALSHWYYALYAIIFTILFTGYQTMKMKSPFIFFDKTILRKLILMTFFSGLILAPFLYPMISEYDRGRSMDVDVSINNSADLLGYFITGISPITDTGNPIFSVFPDLSANITEILKRMGNSYGVEVYLFSFFGYSVILLMIYTIKKAYIPDIRFWSISAIIFFILTLGPVLHFFGMIDFWGIRIPLPGYLLTKIPLLSILAKPSRFTVMLLISVAVICGYGLRKIFLEKKYANVIFNTFIIIFLIEMLVIPFFIHSAPIPEIYNEIANDPGDFAIVEVPFKSDFYQYYQTFHQKKLIGGYIARQPKKVEEFINNNSVLSKLRSPQYNIAVSSDIMKRDVNFLRDNNIKYIVIHPSFFIWDPEYGNDYNLIVLTDFLNTTVGKPQYSKDIVLYKIG